MDFVYGFPCKYLVVTYAALNFPPSSPQILDLHHEYGVYRMSLPLPDLYTVLHDVALALREYQKFRRIYVGSSVSDFMALDYGDVRLALSLARIDRSCDGRCRNHYQYS